MESKQKELLKKLAKDLKSGDHDLKKAMRTLKSAKILTRRGNFTSNYKNLKRVTRSAH